MKPTEIAFGILRIPSDFLMTLMAFILAYRIRSISGLIPGINLPFDVGSFPPINDYIQFSIIASLLLTFIFGVRRMYSLKSTIKFSREFKQIFMATSIWLMGIIAYFFLIRTFPFSRLATMYTWALAIVLISTGRILIRFIQYLTLMAGVGKKPMIFIGSNTITERLAKDLKKDISYQIIGCIDDAEKKSAIIPYLGQITDLESFVKKFRIEEIIQTKPDLNHQQSADLLNFCREHHLSFSFVPDLMEIQQANIETETWGEIPVIKLKPTPLDGWGKVFKRIFDIVGASAGVILLSPFLIISAIAIKLDSKGTILFKFLDDGERVKRVGEHGKLFNFYKFRTMYPNTHNLRYTKLAEKNTRKDSPLVKIKDDPRITRVGKFLRKTSIDELPQLINVLKGEMSLVGPRPHLPEEVAKYQKHHKFVLAIKPGITGLAQTSGRSDLNFEEEVRLDTYYIEHWSPWLDIVIILKTFRVIFKSYQE
ncbi:MAG: sugar transferase [Candidatus Gracilibacteria bacterium]